MQGGLKGAKFFLSHAIADLKRAQTALSDARVAASLDGEGEVAEAAQAIAVNIEALRTKVQQRLNSAASSESNTAAQQA